MFHKGENGGERGGLWPTALAALLVIAGLFTIGIALASQDGPPSPPPNASPDHVAPSPAAASAAAPAPEIPARRASEKPALALSGPVMAPAKPVALDIPAIGVHSVLQHLGQTSTGALEVPSGENYNDAAWYRHSPTPGSMGPAVLLGHVDSAADGPSVFFRLGELERGNRISVERADGSVAVFVVDEVRSYPKDDFPTDLVYGDIDHAGLRVLTCGGVFDDAAGRYLDNIVVFASLLRTL